MKSSFGRSFTTVALILLLSLALLGASFQRLVKDYLTETTFARLEQNAGVITRLISSYTLDGDIESLEMLRNMEIAADLSNYDLVICDLEGRVLMCSDVPFSVGNLRLQINQRYLDKVIENGIDRAAGEIRGLYNESRFLVALPIADASGERNLGIAIVSTSTADTYSVLTKLANYFLSTAMVVIMISIIMVSVFVGRESRPMRELAKAANDFGHGNLDARVHVDEGSSIEMRDLATAFNNMAISLQKSEYQRQEFVANVSHELKTPMTTISGYVDGILDGTIPESRRNHYLRIVSDETKRLARLVRSMLDISLLQNEGGIPDEKKLNFDLEECAGLVLLNFEQKINDKRLEVEVDMPEHPVLTFANQDSITQVIYNLLDNAIKFCPEEGTLGLKITEGGKKVYVSISNTGETIPPEELPLVFDRFHKIDKSRSQNRDGWGLGLYIVKTIINSHGENISVISRDGRTKFVFTMPRVN